MQFDMKKNVFKNNVFEWSRYSFSRDRYSVFLLKMSRFIFILQLYFCIILSKAVAQDGMICFRCSTNLCIESKYGSNWCLYMLRNRGFRNVFPRENSFNHGKFWYQLRNSFKRSFNLTLKIIAVEAEIVNRGYSMMTHAAFSQTGTFTRFRKRNS